MQSIYFGLSNTLCSSRHGEIHHVEVDSQIYKFWHQRRFTGAIAPSRCQTFSSSASSWIPVFRPAWVSDWDLFCNTSFSWFVSSYNHFITCLPRPPQKTTYNSTHGLPHCLEGCGERAQPVDRREESEAQSCERKPRGAWGASYIYI